VPLSYTKIHKNKPIGAAMMKHLACIMDGNRRWAKSQGWLPWFGHKEGVEAAKRAIEFCLENKISYLSLYTFSTENFKRPREEISYLFDIIFYEALEALLPMCKEQQVRVKFIGDRSLFPISLTPRIEQLEEETKQYSRLTLNVLFCYGAQQEMVSGVKNIIAAVKAGALDPDDISEATITQNLWTNGTPPPDMILRTGGVKRLSNFLLYQAAYSEFYFLDCMWPEIQKKDLAQAVSYFNECRRNFGI
jgi:undecaprenyl diphosphate synthase